MEWIKGSIKYLLKAYFGGCFGCLGALSAVVVLGLIFAITLGPTIVPWVQSVPGMLFPSGLGPGLPIPGGPGVTPPSSGMPPAADCYKTIDAWVSKSEFGPPTTTFSRTDGIFPVVANPTDCGLVSAKLLDPNGKILKEKSSIIKGGGLNGYGDYNPSKNLPPGSYKMQFWYGENLLKTIQLTIQ